MAERERGGPWWRREAAAFLAQGSLMVRGFGRRPAPVVGDRVVVFVHGLGATGPVFDPMRAHLTACTGLPAADYTYSWWSSFGQVTSGFQHFVDRHLSPTSRLVIVGHSLGGLVARWFVQEQGGADRVDALVLLATPHAGTRSARYTPGPLTRCILPESAIVAKLAGGAHEFVDIPHTAVVAGEDRLVTPPESAAALPEAEVVWFDDLGHNEMLFDRRVHEVVARSVGKCGGDS